MQQPHTRPLQATEAQKEYSQAEIVYNLDEIGLGRIIIKVMSLDAASTWRMEERMKDQEDFANMAQTLVAIVLDQVGMNKNLTGKLDDWGFVMETLQDDEFYIISGNDANKEGYRLVSGNEPTEEPVRFIYQLSAYPDSIIHPNPTEPDDDMRNIITTTDFLEVLVHLKRELEG